MHVQDGLTYVGALTTEAPAHTPLEKAQAEIRNLCLRTDLMGKIALDGRELSVKDVAENARKRTELARLRREIILRHGVEEHFLSALQKDATRYLTDVNRVMAQITHLEAGIAARDQKA